jgi:hypothetical protein
MYSIVSFSIGYVIYQIVLLFKPKKNSKMHCPDCTDNCVMKEFDVG